jgi:hypothetical protein
MISKRDKEHFQTLTGLRLAIDEFQAAFLHVLVESAATTSPLSMTEACRRTLFALHVRDVTRVFVKRETDDLEKQGLIIKEREYRPFTVRLVPGMEKEVAAFLEARNALLAKSLSERERNAVESYVTAKQMREQLSPSIKMV